MTDFPLIPRTPSSKLRYILEQLGGVHAQDSAGQTRLIGAQMVLEQLAEELEAAPEFPLPSGHPAPPPACPYSYHDEHDEGVDAPCVCEPHVVGDAYGCPEGCPTHNHGGPDVVEGSIGGRATDPELTDEDRCPVCGCVVGPDCEACARDCQTPVPAPVAGVATGEEQPVEPYFGIWKHANLGGVDEWFWRCDGHGPEWRTQNGYWSRERAEAGYAEHTASEHTDPKTSEEQR